MNFYEFTLLSDEKQFELVFKEGEFIDFKEIGKSRFVLYRIYNFIAEIQYEISQNKIVGKVVFQNN